MPSMQSIRSRIRGVESTKQITHSMRLVSSSKVQQAGEYLEQITPFVEHSRQMMEAIKASNSLITHPYFQKSPEKNAGLILISSDRGLCGGYNIGVAKAALDLAETKEEVTLIGIGSRIKDVLRRGEREVDIQYLGITETPLYEEAQMIAMRAAEMYLAGEIDQLYVVYTHFDTMIEQHPVVKELLPLEILPADEMKPEYLWEPSLSVLLDQVVPAYLTAEVLGAMGQAALSEQSARVMSMDAASRNSDEIIAELTLKYNQARQDAITQEITEIVGGASAVTE